MSKMKAIATMLAVGAMFGGMNTGAGYFDEDKLNDRSRYKGKGFSGGQSQMRTFVINGIEIMATDLKMAKKKYAALKK